MTESWLKSALGIDIAGRADCVKGMVWSITNMCGTGGCQDFFRWANLSNSMTDREFVTALSNSVVNNVATKYASQPQYHEGWKNRYKNELKDCLVYIAEDEAAAEETPSEPDPEPKPAPAPAPHPNKAPAAPAGPTVETDSDADNGGETGAPSTGVGNNGAGNGGTASGGTESAGGAGDSGSGSTGGSVSGSTGGPSNGSTDVGESSGTDSDSTEDSDVSNSSTENKSSFVEQLGAMIGSSMTAGNNIGSSSGEALESRTDGDADATIDAGARQSDADAQKVDDKNVTSTTTMTTTTTTTKASGGNMPKTGDLIVMASLASASLATLGATSIVSGKHKLDQQKKFAGEDGSEE